MSRWICILTRYQVAFDRIGPHIRMLDDLSLRIDATDSKLTAANKRLKAFIRANEGKTVPFRFAIIADKAVAFPTSQRPSRHIASSS